MITRRNFLKGVTFAPIAAFAAAAAVTAAAAERPKLTWQYGTYTSVRFYEGPITPVRHPSPQWQKLNQYYGKR
jgi:hypothetical protein